MTLSFPLTFALSRDYAFFTTEFSVVRIGVLETRRMSRLQAVFLRPLHGMPLFGRVVWRAERLAGSLFQYANPHDSAHPILIGEAENSNRLKRSLT